MSLVGPSFWFPRKGLHQCKQSDYLCWQKHWSSHGWNASSSITWQEKPPVLQPNYTPKLALLTPLSAAFSAELLSLFSTITAAILYPSFVLCLFCVRMICVPPSAGPIRGTVARRLQGHCLCSTWIATSNSSWESCFLFWHMEESTLLHQFMVCSEAQTFCIHRESKV